MAEVRNIGIFGRMNAGKSSMINILSGQEVSIVSPGAGTTTDPVRKRMEFAGIGPCNLIDTAGIDDGGELGGMRVRRSRAAMHGLDLALLLFTGNHFGKEERKLFSDLRDAEVPVLLVHNQSDIIALDPDTAAQLKRETGSEPISFSCCLLEEAEQQRASDALIGKMAALLSGKEAHRTILEGLVEEGDRIVLVCPVDSEAPEGRLILPQVMAIRDILDRKGVAVVLRPEELEPYLKSVAAGGCGTEGNGGNPVPRNSVRRVITDSQAFREVSRIVPEEIPLTSFSILLSRAKGPFELYLRGAGRIDTLQDGDRVLMLEACTHHSTCEDIGRVKIPRLLRKYTGKELQIDFAAGSDEIPVPPDGRPYALAVQCGGCMATRRQLIGRVRILSGSGVPVTNYGMAIAHMNGILKRAVAGLQAEGRPAEKPEE